MKWIRMFESFSEDKSILDDYLLDFTDNDFNIDIKLSGSEIFIYGENKYCKSKLEDVHEWYSDLLLKISHNWHILFSKTYFNNTTSNLSFEIKISNPIKDENSIKVNVLNNDIEWTPINGIRWWHRPEESRREGLIIPGKLKNNIEKTLDIGIYVHEKTGNSKMYFGFGNRSSGVKVSPENINKLISMIESDEITCLGDKPKVLSLLKNNN